MMTSPQDKADDATKRRGEFAIIADCFAPLTQRDPLAFALTDDAAVLRPQPGMDVVVTADAMVAGVHFFADDPPEDIARKLLRVNLSDLAAKGAEPLSYVLTCAWPRGLELAWIKRFVQGLAQDQQEFDLHLIGGDTVATGGPLALSLTAFGQVPQGFMIRRAGAKPGDLVCVSGAIGDGAAGLSLASGEAHDMAAADRDYLLARYRLPEPRLRLGRALRGLAHACADVSDGLLADAAHVGEASGVRLVIEAAAVPVSTAARKTGLQQAALLTGGDDYELLFTLGADQSNSLATLSQEVGVALTIIGRVEAGPGGAILLDEQGREIDIADKGYQHF